MKLTKRQRKTQEFRDKKVPVVDVRADVSAEAQIVKLEKGKGAVVGGDTADKKNSEVKADVKAKDGELSSSGVLKEQASKASESATKSKEKRQSKRKHLYEDGKTDETVPASNGRGDQLLEGKPKPSKKKRFDDEGLEIPQTEATPEPPTALGEKVEGKRYIVFVGNMSYKSTSVEIAKHFENHCHESPKVRLLTTRGDPAKLAALSKSKQKSIAKGKSFDPSAPQSKGCAFLEFETQAALQKALQFHHTTLHGRQINVELTAGGGGTKSTHRKERIAKKNHELEQERKKLHDKYFKGAGNKEQTTANGKGAAQGPPETPSSVPQWGPNAAKSAKGNVKKTKVPRWAASGANAIQLHG